MTGSVILLEFNELCPPLLSRWMAQGLLPNFKKFHDDSLAFVTEADADAPALEPWIQWYSIHTGLSYDQHKVFRLTDGPGAGHKDIWAVLREQGLPVASFASMNTKAFAEPGSVYMADPWCTTEPAYPDELNTFHQFVAKHVQEYTNPAAGDALSELVKFVRFLGGHGVRPATVTRIMRLLFNEKFVDKRSTWRRAVVLDWLQTDLFLHYFQRMQPKFSSFFLNSTAHFQHAFWRYMEPDLFQARPSDADIAEYKDAILFGYRNMDELLGRFFELEKSGVRLVLTTALSQQPYLKNEKIGGQRFYRVRDLDRLIATLDIDCEDVQPTMTHQYMMRCADAATTDRAANALSGVKWDGNEVFGVDRRGNNSIYFGNQILNLIPDDAKLQLRPGQNEPAEFFDHFYMIDHTKSGFHHPDGIAWFKTGHPEVRQEKTSILNIFPTLLDMMEIDYQPSADHPFTGKSLLSA